MKDILLIDGHSLFYRSFFGSLKMKAYHDQDLPFNLNAVFLFIRILKSLQKKYQFDNTIITFDKKTSKNLRAQKLTSYKSNRPQPPHELIQQLPILKEYLDTAKILYLEEDNYEADDIIGTLAKKANNHHWTVKILTSDKDLFQLINPLTSVLFNKTGGVKNIIELTIDNFYDIYKMQPSQVIDFKGIAGDSSDNIKGVPGIGTVGATKLLHEYQSLEGIYQNLHKIGTRYQTLLQKYQKNAFLAKEIATIKTDVNLKSFQTFIETAPNIKNENHFFAKYKMWSLLTKVTKKTEAPKFVPPSTHKPSTPPQENNFDLFNFNNSKK